MKTNGVSVLGLLGDTPATIPERTLYWEFGKQVGDPNSGVVGEVFQAARRGRWKAVRYGVGNPVEIFDLENDPGEEFDRSKIEPEVHREFVALFEEHKG